MSSSAITWPEVSFGPVNLWNCPDFVPAHSRKIKASPKKDRSAEIEKRKTLLMHQIALASKWS